MIQRIEPNRTIAGHLTTRFRDPVKPYRTDLERDCLQLLQLDYRVLKVRTVLPTFDIAMGAGYRPYTPGICAVWHRPRYCPWGRQHMFIEVRSSAELAEDGGRNAPFWRAVRETASLMKCGFVMLTEKEIRVRRLKNAEFLNEYWDVGEIGDLFGTIMKTTEFRNIPLSIRDLRSIMVAYGWPEPKVRAAIYNSIVQRHLVVDLDEPLTDMTPVRNSIDLIGTYPTPYWEQPWRPDPEPIVQADELCPG